LSSYFVFDEICPTKILKYETEYSSPEQNANFITIQEANEKKRVYFNGQLVSSRTAPFIASNGMFYYLETVKTNHLADFLFEMISYLKRKTNSYFFDQLNPNWKDVIQKEGYNTTLFLPVLTETELKNVRCLFFCILLLNYIILNLYLIKFK
jgi:hypothetical protein